MFTSSKHVYSHKRKKKYLLLLMLAAYIHCANWICVLWMCGGDRERVVLWQTKINSYLCTIFFNVLPCLFFLAQVSLFVRQTKIVFFLLTYCKKSLLFLSCSVCPLWNLTKAHFLIGAFLSRKTWSWNFFSTLKGFCFSNGLTSPKRTRQDHFFVLCDLLQVFPNCVQKRHILSFFFIKK